MAVARGGWRENIAAVTLVLAVPWLEAPGLSQTAESNASPRSKAQTYSIAAGESWTVPETTRLTRLAIGEGARLVAPSGYSLTLTVDGVETDIRAGTYTGKIVLTTTRDIPVKYLPDDPAYLYRAAVYVQDDKYVADKSVAAAVSDGTVTGTAASDLAISSMGENFNGIMVTGNSNYSIVNPRIQLEGNGGNDFAGYGAAILSSGHANVTLEGAHIETTGAIRTAIFVGGHSTMTVNNSFIEVHNGVLPANHAFSVMPGRMMEVPYGLGIRGNVRATNLIESGTVYYNNSHIRAQAWGALSSDGDEPTRMYATNSLIETIESGYGAYSDGQAQDRFSHCTFNVADFGLIVGGNGSATFTDGTIVNSRRFGVMMHQGTGGSELIIDKGSIFRTKSTLIEIKGRGANILIDDAQLLPENGILLQTMDNDDPIMKQLAGTGMKLPAGMPGFGGKHATFSGNVNVTLKAAKLKGDLVHAMKGTGALNVTLNGATLTGAISAATASPASGQAPTKETYQTIGNVTNTFGAVEGPYGVDVFLDGGSTWVVDKTSYINQLTLEAGGAVAAPAGRSIQTTVDGVVTAIKPGTYSGAIVLEVSQPITVQRTKD